LFSPKLDLNYDKFPYILHLKKQIVNNEYEQNNIVRNIANNQHSKIVLSFEIMNSTDKNGIAFSNIVY